MDATAVDAAAGACVAVDACAGVDAPGAGMDTTSVDAAAGACNDVDAAASMDAAGAGMDATAVDAAAGACVDVDARAGVDAAGAGVDATAVDATVRAGANAGAGAGVLAGLTAGARVVPGAHTNVATLLAGSSYWKRRSPCLTDSCVDWVLPLTATSTTEPSPGFWNATSRTPAWVLADFTRTAPRITNRLKWAKA